MIISIDRQSNLFTPEMCDRINKKSTDLYENIQALQVPEKAFKETVTPFSINSSKRLEQHCYSIGRTNILCFKILEDISAQNEFQLLGTLPVTPATDMLWQIDGKGIFRIDATKPELYIYPFSGAGKDYWVYTFYNS